MIMSGTTTDWISMYIRPNVCIQIFLTHYQRILKLFWNHFEILVGYESIIWIWFSFQKYIYVMYYRFLTTETNSKALYIYVFCCFNTTSSVKLFVVTVQIFLCNFLFTMVSLGKREKIKKPFTFENENTFWKRIKF